MTNFTRQTDTLLAMLLAASIVSTSASAQDSTWLIPGDGFFETATNWSPEGVPGPNDTIRFVLQLEQTVSLFNDQTVSALEANNGADVAFGLAGPSSRRTLQVNGDARFEDGAALGVSGNGVDSFVLGIQGDLTGAQTLSVEAGGVLSAQLASFAAETGLPINIDGENSALNVDRLMVDHNNGPLPELTILNGASITAQSFTDLDRVNVTMSGEDVGGNGASWNTGHLDILIGNLRMSDGANITSATVNYGGASVSPDMILSGMDSLGRPTTWNITDELEMAGSVPTIHIREGAQLFTKDISTRASIADIEVGLPNSTEVARWFTDGNVYVGGTDVGPSGGAEFEVESNGEAHISGTIRIWEDGAFRLNPNGKLVADRIENQHGGGFNFIGGTLQTNWFVGDLENRRGTLTPGGDEAGHTTIVGDYTHLADSTLAIDIGGTTPGAEHDVLETAGFTFVDGGGLELELINGFTPTPSDEFVIAAAASIVGSFHNVLDGERLDTLDGSGSFVVNYGFDSAFDTRNIVLSDFQLGGNALPDFDGDGLVDCADVDALVAEIVSKTNTATYDLTGDGMVDHTDLAEWLSQAGSINLPSGNSFVEGDANLDGVVDGLDFIDWNANKFTETAAWCSGDFNADGIVDGLDFIVWNSNKFTSADAHRAAVPEPTSAFLVLTLFALVSPLAERKATTLTHSQGLTHVQRSS